MVEILCNMVVLAITAFVLGFMVFAGAAFIRFPVSAPMAYLIATPLACWLVIQFARDFS